MSELSPSLFLFLQLLLGQEDLDTLIKFGLNMAETIVPLVKKKGSLFVITLTTLFCLNCTLGTGEIAGAVVEGLTGSKSHTHTLRLNLILLEDTTIKPEPVECEEEVQEETYKKMTVSVSLSGFKLQIFKNEPILVIDGWIDAK